MGISKSVSMALKQANLKQNDMATAYGKSKQSMSMKFSRDSWFGKDLVRVADLVGAELAFIFPDGTKIRIRSDDPQEGAE